MNILQVYPYFYPAWGYGGPPRVVYDISKHLADRGHDVTVYTTDALDKKSRITISLHPQYINGIRTYYFKNLSNYLAYNHNLALPVGMFFRTKKEIKEFDVIHLHGGRTFLNIVVYHYAKKYGIPYVLQPRGSVPTISKSKPKKLFDVLFGHAIINDASKIIASSKIESDQYWDVFPELNDEKIVHIPNGIDLETYQNLPQKGEFKKKYSINADEKIILFLSRIHERKGADILVEAFSELKNEFGNVKLVIAGPDEGYLGKLKLIVSKLNIGDAVIFPGPLYEKDKLEAYVDADVFVLPSKDRYESFGNVALEACACGTPVIVTNNCGVSEWFDRDAMIIIKPEENALYQGILKILKKELFRNRMIARAKKSVFSLSWSEVVNRIEEVYTDITISEVK